MEQVICVIVHECRAINAEAKEAVFGDRGSDKRKNVLLVQAKKNAVFDCWQGNPAHDSIQLPAPGRA
jgi:hypothetical protein